MLDGTQLPVFLTQDPQRRGENLLDLLLFLFAGEVHARLLQSQAVPLAITPREAKYYQRLQLFVFHEGDHLAKVHHDAVALGTFA